jgi:DNA-binding transcriptional LysR family regulator
MLNLSQVEAFVAVIETGSFHEAAKKLGCSQPKISQQLRKLEEALHATLVTRDRRNCEATGRGARLLPFARNLLRSAERVHDVVSGRKIMVGASSNVGIYLLQPFVARYANECGSSQAIDLAIAGNPEIADRLSGGELDVAVMEWWDRRQGFSATRWRQEKLVVIVSPDHPWARKKSVNPKSLFEQSMVGGEAGTGTGTLLQKIFGDEASKIRVSHTLGSTEGVKAAVKAGLGVSLVFASAVEEEVRAGSLCALSVSGVEVRKDIFVVLPDDIPPDAPSRNFVRMLMSAVCQERKQK